LIVVAFFAAAALMFILSGGVGVKEVNSDADLADRSAPSRARSGAFGAKWRVWRKWRVQAPSSDITIAFTRIERALSTGFPPSYQ